MSVIKQVIVMRTDLGMRKGKLIAQGAHASMKVFLERGTVRRSPGMNPDPMERVPPEYSLSIPMDPNMAHWVENLFTKICVRALSEEQLLDVYRAAQEAGLPCALVEDVGKTEFHGVKTPTAVAIGPARAEDIDPITGGLTLL